MGNVENGSAIITTSDFPTDSALIRWGFYLRPDYATCQAQATLHDLLQRQYGLIAGGTFMPHATIKGFFRSDATQEEIIAALDPLMASTRPFPVHNRGPMAFGTTGIALDVHHTPDGEPNEPFVRLYHETVAALKPLIDHECVFSNREASHAFFAHLTLAMADIPEPFFGEIRDFVTEACPIGSDAFEADVFHLYAFTSDDWDGPWWETLRWELRHGWRLGA